MDKFSLEEMRNFFNKRELVSFSISNGNHKIPKKRNFLRTRTSSSEDAESTYEIFPNGEFHRLKRVEISKGKNIDDSTTIREFKYRRGLLHGRHSSKKNIGNRTFDLEGEFRKGKPHGTFFLYRDGAFSQSCTFVKGKALESSLDTLSKETTIFCRNEKEEYHITRTREFGISPFVIRIEEEKVLGGEILEARERNFSETEPVEDEVKCRDCRFPDSRDSFEHFLSGTTTL